MLCEYTIIEAKMDKQNIVKEFHEKFGLTVNNLPTIPSDKDVSLRIGLILEEAHEFEVASRDKNIIEVADAIADLLYVVYGAALTYGLPADKLFEEVHRSNMSKVWPDGKVHRREEDGKILKPATYSEANIKNVLFEGVQ